MGKINFQGTIKLEGPFELLKYVKDAKPIYYTKVYIVETNDDKPQSDLVHGIGVSQSNDIQEAFNFAVQGFMADLKIKSFPIPEE